MFTSAAMSGSKIRRASYGLFLLCLCVISLSIVLMPSSSYAANGICNSQVGIVSGVVKCIEQVVGDGLIASALPTIQNHMSKAVGAVLTLYIVVFAIRSAMGETVQRIGNEGFVVILSVSAVIYFTLNSGVEDILALFRTTQSHLVDVVSASMGTAVGCTEPDIWLRVDCTIRHFMGSEIASSDVSDFLFRVGSGFIGQSVGIFMIFAISFCSVLLILAFAQATLVYIQAFVAVTFLALLSPIIIPMILFKQTKRMFDFWLQLLFAYTLQPAILMGYMTFMVHVVNIAIAGPGGSGGLTDLYHELDAAAKDGRVVVTSQSNTEQPFAGIPANLGNTLQQNFGKDNTSIVLPEMLFSSNPNVHDKKTSLLLQNFLILGVLLSLTFGFMTNVLNFGAQLAGMGASSVAQSVNIYNSTVDKMVSAMQGGKK